MVSNSPGYSRSWSVHFASNPCGLALGALPLGRMWMQVHLSEAKVMHRAHGNPEDTVSLAAKHIN